VHREKEFAEMLRYLETSASHIGKGIIDVLTNIKSTSWSRAQWGALSHGCGLATIAHVLDKRFRHVLVASTGGYADLHFWGSHVLTDPLLSSGQMTFVHDGGEAGRIEKTKFVVGFPQAMNSLHVCYKLGSEENCSRCMKCYRTMATLDLFNAKDKAPTFDWRQYRVKDLRNLLIIIETDRYYMTEIRNAAIEARRWDIVQAVRESLWLSNFLRPLALMIRKMKNRRYFRRLGIFLDWLLLSRLIQ